MILEKDEKIKAIPGYEGRYFITNYGRVFSLVSNKWLSPTKNKHGNSIRYYVNLGRGNNNRFYIHQLVATAFCENPNHYTEIDHIDTNPSNNHADNLRWVTHKENLENQKTRENLKNNSALLNEVLDLKTGKTYWGYAETAEAVGLSKITILNHCNNKVKNPRFKKTGRLKHPKNNTIF